MIRITTFAGKRVAVFGLGASGIATAKALVAGGAEVVACDDSAAGMQAAAEAGLQTADLKDANWADSRSLVLAPGVPLTHPEPHWTVREGQATPASRSSATSSCSPRAARADAPMRRSSPSPAPTASRRRRR